MVGFDAFQAASALVGAVIPFTAAGALLLLYHQPRVRDRRWWLLFIGIGLVLLGQIVGTAGRLVFSYLFSGTMTSHQQWWLQAMGVHSLVTTLLSAVGFVLLIVGAIGRHNQPAEL